MWNAIVTVGGWLALLLLILVTAHWTDLERKYLKGNGDSRYLE